MKNLFNSFLIVLLAIVFYCGGIYGQVTTITTTSISATTGTSVTTGSQTQTGTGVTSITTSVTKTVQTSTLTTGIQTLTDTISVTGTVTTPVSAAHMEKPAWGSAGLALTLLALTIFFV